jgi:hypothetical protein
MRASTKTQLLRALVALSMLEVMTCIYSVPDLVMPGLVILLALILVQYKLWRMLSTALVAEAQAERNAL